MKVHRCVEDGELRFALVKDLGTLPKLGRGWTPAGTFELRADDPPRIGANSADIIAAIEAHGFFLWPQHA